MDSDVNSHSTHPDYIVGVGASAGGLDAYKAFFRSLPADTRMAFVLVQHLDPHHESLMVDLLSRCTEMTVSQATDGERVAPNHVYMIPPNRTMTIKNGKLRLTEQIERRGLRMAVDTFLRTLAEDQGEKSIGIVLSGTGSDGSEGLRAIKACGGLTLVQDPASAAHDGMPRSAIAASTVDVVCSPEAMSEALLNYASHTPVHVGEPSKSEDPHASSFLNSAISLLLTRRNMDFRQYKQGTLLRRIQRRMQLHRIGDKHQYLELLRNSNAELEQLERDLLICVTSFFRDPAVFEALGSQVIADMVARTRADETLRVWVPGCATGEEAYSIAILFQEYAQKQEKLLNLQVFASDIDEHALETARQGKYPLSSVSDLSSERIEQYFQQHDEENGADFVTVKKSLREMVLFARQNLATDPPFSKLDLISCRNLLIYLQQPVQDKIIRLFHFSIRQSGFLLLGNSEHTGNQAALFKCLSKPSRIYQRVESSIPTGVDLRFNTADTLSTPASRSVYALSSRSHQPRIADIGSRWILDEYAPPSVVVNRRLETLYFSGSVDKYLRYPSGEPNLNLLDLVRDSIQARLRTALYSARDTDKPVETGRLRAVGPLGTYFLKIRVKPVSAHTANSEQYLLVSFIDLQSNLPDGRVDPDSDISSTSEQYDSLLVKQLEGELKSTREDLQSTMEEMETSNEELKASNEEMMSINEELQSTNEELETSKEELQSLNEELTTLNSQLQEKVEELENANNDILNLLHSTDVATLFLDQRMRIKRFTPATKILFNLIESDVGRPLRDITAHFSDPDLQPDAKQVLAKLTPREKEVRLDDGRWFNRCILPYRTQDDRIDGVVVTFIDVTAARSRARQQSLIAELGRIALMGVDPENLLEESVKRVAEGLDVEFSKVLRLNEDQKSLLLVSGVGWQQGCVGTSVVQANEGSQAGFTLLASKSMDSDTTRVGPVIFVENLPTEKRFEGPQLLLDHGIVSGLSVAIPGRVKPFGVLGAHSHRIRRYSSEDGEFLRAIAHILANGVARWNSHLARLAAEDEMFREKERAQVTLASIGDAVITTDRDGVIDYVNAAAEILLGWSCREAVGQHITKVFRIVDEQTGDTIEDPVTRCLQLNDTVHLEANTSLINRTEHRIAIQDSAAPIREKTGGVLGAVLVFHDASEQRRLTREFSHLASHDSLTGLVNRREFLRRLDRVVKSANNDASEHVLLYMDLDNIKPINDTAGHAAGDELLRQVSLLFLNQIRQRDNLARLAGDEFALLLEHSTMEQAQYTAEKLLQVLQEFVFVREKYTFRISVSIGMVPINADSTDSTDLIHAADSACYIAKSKGKNCIHIPQLHAANGNGRSANKRKNWVEHITTALQHNQFVLYSQTLQPIAQASQRDDGIFCEILVRLKNDSGDLLEPDIFIPEAERLNLCNEIDRWVIENTFKAVASYPQLRQRLRHLAINLSGQSMGNPDLLSFISDKLEEFKVDPESICFEITETAAISNLSNALVLINQLASRGCRFSLDDFGTGLSSYAYLKSLPVNYLKIDGLFIRRMHENPIDIAMVKSICEIGHLLDKKIIAEHVESEYALEKLKNLGVDYVQGNFIHSAVSLDDYLHDLPVAR